MKKRSFLLLLFIFSFGLGGVGMLAYLLDLVFETEAVFSKKQLIQFGVLMLSGLFFLIIRGRERN